MKTITVYQSEDGRIFAEKEDCLSYERSIKEAEEAFERRIQSYIDDPNTEVFIYENDEAGIIQFSVVVESSKDFWLDSFKTLTEAQDYIKRNNLNCTRVIRYPR